MVAAWVLMEGRAKGDVFLLLPRVLMEGRAFEGCFGKGGLDLVATNLLAEWALAKGG